MLLSIMCKGSRLSMAYGEKKILFINVTQSPPKKDDKTSCAAVTKQKRFRYLMFKPSHHVQTVTMWILKFFPQKEFNMT